MNSQGESNLLSLIRGAIAHKYQGTRGCITLITEVLALGFGLGFLSAILRELFGAPATPWGIGLAVFMLVLYFALTFNRRIRIQAEATPTNAVNELSLDNPANSSVDNIATPLIQTQPAEPKDRFFEMRSHATKQGALAGLVGAIAGPLVVGCALELIVDTLANVAEASGFAFIAMFLVCSGYPLLGAAGGALIGRLSVKRNDDPKEEGAVVRQGMRGGGIAGLVIGILPYVLFWLYILLRAASSWVATRK